MDKFLLFPEWLPSSSLFLCLSLFLFCHGFVLLIQRRRWKKKEKRNKLTIGSVIFFSYELNFQDWSTIVENSSFSTSAFFFLFLLKRRKKKDFSSRFIELWTVDEKKNDFHVDLPDDQLEFDRIERSSLESSTPKISRIESIHRSRFSRLFFDQTERRVISTWPKDHN